jgi:hypothetical protein
MRLWNWLSNNSSALQVAAAILVILGGLAAIPSLVLNSLKPDLVLQINPDRSTVPDEIVPWMTDVVRELDTLPENSKEAPKKLYELASSPIQKRFFNYRSSKILGNRIDRINIEVVN